MTLSDVLAFMDGAAQAAELVPGIGAGAKVADIFLSIAVRANQKHIQITGTPIDLTKFHDIEPLPVPVLAPKQSTGTAPNAG